MTEPEQTTKSLHEAIQETLHSEDAGDCQGNVVTSWVCIAESMDVEGHRWLSRMDGAPGGGRLSEWAAEGLLFNALHSGGWDDYEVEDGDD